MLLAPLSAAALWQAEGREGLTTIGATLARATDDGHTLTPVLLALAGASAAVAVGFALLERAVTVPRAVRTGFVVVVLALLTLGAAAVWREEGSPWHLADRAWSSFRSPPTQTGADVSERLFQLSSNGRLDLWETSWESLKRDPVLGNGAGTFWQLWAANPDRGQDTTEGHSLYMEALGELGIVGLALLVLALATPLGGALRARATPLGAPAAGAYAAWLAHAGIDWDWELVGVTAPALLCGVSLLAAARAEGSGAAPAAQPPHRWCRRLRRRGHGRDPVAPGRPGRRTWPRRPARRGPSRASRRRTTPVGGLGGRRSRPSCAATRGARSAPTAPPAPPTWRHSAGSRPIGGCGRSWQTSATAPCGRRRSAGRTG